MDRYTGLPVVGMVGGGQLARMTHQASIALGQSLHVLAKGESDSAGLVAGTVVTGSHTDLEALRSFAAEVDVVTFDHEHVPNEHLQQLVEDGYTVRPGPYALLHAQDKLAMRRKLATLDCPAPSFAAVTEAGDVTAFAREHGWPVVLKAARGGYDGKGVWVVENAERAEELFAELADAKVALLVEEKVPMRRELSALVARSPFGQGAAWPVVETVQRGGINTEVLAPAPGLTEAAAHEAKSLALRIAAELDVVGVLAVELFDTDDGVVVNELAMRPHNSGHWTMNGSVTSQFEQHLRAVLDYPLGVTDAVAPACVMANVLGATESPRMGIDERVHHLFARFPDARVHLYGKEERPGRKLGHVNVLGSDMAGLAERARLAAHWLAHAEWPDGYRVHERE
ncbi:5-(carboxyamino)imidazole ribonucleotide synthase [Haloechinothrix sp. LS1_15]|uniref:5-(carboxyamino)imidazole ribonucleotide synthase n=1 Tax=Haloechinothrix sp. LS1_15 TaxID=2652248 RepID=UPI002946CC17|nr:5-(carboxyamino)imidazole ribonucleotide synthase [Haloechinothrix sp. LS1_15]MDV6013930.1 5-(carboxyamino)imidazole ribonucleotide synthase [Haloechinothrix sp. LS1_15]